MKQIELTRGFFALIDDKDFKYLNQWNWYFDNTGYAVRKPREGKIYMHRLINNTPDEFETDHINRNKLDNRRINLRSVTSSQNSINTSLRKDNISGHKGIHFDKSRNKYMVYLNIKNKRLYLGRFNTMNEAIVARRSSEKIYHGNT